MSFGILIIRHSDGRYETRSLDRATYSIGSAADNDLVLQDTSVAPQHIQIVSDDRGSRILDLGSPGGTTLGGQPLDQTQQSLASGAIIGIGATQIVVDLAPPPVDTTLRDMLATPIGERPPKATVAPPPQPPPQIAAPPPAPTASADIGLRLSAEAVQVEAGKSMTVRVTVRNRSTIVDQVDLGVEGVPAGWVSIKPETHNLYTQTSGEAELVFQPPRTSQSEARTYPISIVATSRVDPEARSTAQLMLNILPFSSYKAGIDPPRRTATMEGGYELRITNLGNRLEQYRISAEDEDTLGFRVSPTSLRVPPGESRAARVRARARKFKLVGRPVNHEFTLAVEPVAGGVEPQVARGSFAQQPPFSTWLVAGLVLLMLAGCLSVAGWVGFGQARAFFAARNATATVVARATEVARQVATSVAERSTAESQLTQITLDRDATLTAITEQQAAKETAARDDAERAAIAATAEAERQAAQGRAATLQAGQNKTILDAATAGVAAEQTKAALEKTAIAAQNARPASTPIYSLTQTAVAGTATANALPIVLAERGSVTAAAIAFEQRLRNATDTAVAAILTAQAVQPPATDSTIAFNQVGGENVSDRRRINYAAYQGQGVILCFFGARRSPYPPPAQAPTPSQAPAAAPTDAPPAPNVVAPTDTPPAAARLDLRVAAATPVAMRSFSLRLQADQPCLTQFDPTRNLPEQLGPGVLTANYEPVIYPSARGSGAHVLTTDNGNANEFIPGAVATVIFPNAVQRVTVSFWHPLGASSIYRMYALDVTGQPIGAIQTESLEFPTKQSLTFDATNTNGRPISAVVLVGLGTNPPSDFPNDILNARQPVFIQSLTLPAN